MNYDLTVIIPFFNSKRFITKILKNCLDISKKNNIEFIFVDNNSSDKSFKILKEKSNNLDIKFYKSNKQDGQGPGVARNIGIKKACSENIMFLDIDDLIHLDGIKKLIPYIKKNKFNLLYLKKNVFPSIKSKIFFSPYRYFNKSNINIFFRNSINMQSIAIIYKKNFLIKQKIFFKKGIYEDIFFIFKCHFFNRKKIKFFNKKFYLKKNYHNSITNSKINRYHILSRFNAWKDIYFFLKSKISKNKFKKINYDLQFRIRGEIYNDYIKIEKYYNLNKKIKNALVNYLLHSYLKILDKKFLPVTNKDHILKRLLNNV